MLLVRLAAKGLPRLSHWYEKKKNYYKFLKRNKPPGVLPYKRLLRMCRWMGSHFHDWVDYNGVVFSMELLEWGRTFSDFWSKQVQSS